MTNEAKASVSGAVELRTDRRFPKIAMLVARFPKVTETFQLREMVTCEQLGVPIELYAITHHDDGGTIQEDARSLDARANYFPRISFEMIRAQLTWIRRNPSAYLKAWKWSLKTFASAPEMFVRSFVVVPLAATMALRMERDGIEHIHAHFATYPTQAALIIHWLTGLPYSFTGHAHDLQMRHEGLRDKITESEFFVTCTQYSQDSLRDLYGAIVLDKGHVVHHGVNLDKFTYREPPAPTNEDGSPRPLRMVCTATFTEIKGHEYLIEAIRLLRDRGKDIDLKLIGGDPPQQSNLQNEIRAQVRAAGLDERVEFLGKRPSDEVMRWIEWADVGVLASVRSDTGDMDGLPNVLTECLAMGRPVVSTRQPGTMELVEHGVNGLLARTRDAEELAACIEQMYDDPDARVRMGIAGHAKVVANENVVDRTTELLNIYAERVGRPL